MEKPTDQIKYQKLADKWLSGTITAAEELLLFRYYDEGEDGEIEIPAEFEGHEHAYRDFLFEKISTDLNSKKNTSGKFWLWSSAAAIILVIGFILFQNTSEPQQRIVGNKTKLDIPSRNVEFSEPVLILEDGSKLILSKDRLSALSGKRGLNIHQDSNGKLVYTVESAGNKSSAVLFNEIKTPAGQQFTIFLSDGTKVSLNAGSSLKFPTAFNTSERKVTLSGEAYFEVAKNKNKPFKVSTLNQEIEVLGTHFNVNAYNNEALNKTTLVEGSVKVKAKNAAHFAILKPGQQAALQTGSLVISQADVEAALAWKFGYFKFNNEDLESIMRKLERWYDVEVVYETEKNPNLAFDGRISQTKSISSILRIIEETGNVHFKVSGRRITVLK